MPDAGRTASAALALAESLLAHEDAAGSILFVTDGIDPADIAAFPAGGSARAALIVAARPRRRGRRLVPPRRRRHRPGQHRRRRRARRPARARLQPRPRRRRRGPPPGRRLAPRAPGRAPRPALVPPRHHAALGRDPARAALLPAGHVRADGLADWFWTPDQQGRRLYDAHRYPEAAATFADPEWRAAALFRAGKYAEAAETLAPIQTSTAQYNRGTALVRGRDYQGAVAAFEAALKLDPGNAAAAHNLDVTKRIIAYLTEAREDEDRGRAVRRRPTTPSTT